MNNKNIKKLPVHGVINKGGRGFPYVTIKDNFKTRKV